MSQNRPAFLFYPADWLGDPAVRAVSLAARGLWTDMLCLMHQLPRRGYLQLESGTPVTAEQLARMTGCSTDEVSRLLQELETAGVFSCTEPGVIYSRRMVREERKRQLCAEAGRKGGGNPRLRQTTSPQKDTFIGRNKGPPKGPPKGRPNPSFSFSISSSTSSSSTSSTPTKDPSAAATASFVLGPAEIRVNALAICRRLWPAGSPVAREGLKKAQDQRLVYRLAVLWANDFHQAWLDRLLGDCESVRPQKPLAWLQSQAGLYAPEGVEISRLLRQIDVPQWAMADPRDWPE